jgi:cytochrome b
MQIKVWDLPIRLFHWGLVFGIALTFIPAGEDPWLRLHVTAGFVVLGLIFFRLFWGFIGSRHALFSTFIRSWFEVRDYLTTLFGPWRKRFIGHNPVTGWYILALLGIILLICLSGLIVYGGEENRGPLSGLLPYAWGHLIKKFHAAASYTLLFMVAVHITGVFVESRLHHENLLKAMWTGKKEIDPSLSSETSYLEISLYRFTSAIVTLYLFCGLSLSVIFYLYKPAPPPIIYSHAIWQKECSACHMAFPPLLLPRSSWERIMADLSNHFGDNASMDPAVTADIAAFLNSHAAETSGKEVSKRILASLSPGQIPLRITDTPYWKEKHKEIEKSIYQRKSVGSPLNCVACHRWADRGSFEDDDIRIPSS